MGNKARKYKSPTIKKLHALSKNQCAAPDCNRPLIAKDEVTIISKICHIQAANEDGPRYNEKMTDDERRHFEPFNIAQKINYNHIKRNKSLIHEYKIFYIKINSLYSVLENQGSFKKDKLLRNIRDLYLKEKRKYIIDDNEIESIRENSDNIIEDIEEILYKTIQSDNDLLNDFSFSISLIMVDAFMRCKILEEPKADDFK